MADILRAAGLAVTVGVFSVRVEGHLQPLGQQHPVFAGAVIVPVDRHFRPVLDSATGAKAHPAVERNGSVVGRRGHAPYPAPTRLPRRLKELLVEPPADAAFPVVWVDADKVDVRLFQHSWRRQAASVMPSDMSI